MQSREEVATEAGRLATFQGPQHLHKRRASATKKKSPNPIVWPHVSPSPEDLAHAGFYYKPTSASNDNVSCFLCNKDIDGWEPDDDPVQQHLILVPNCGWALNVAIAQRIGRSKHQEQDPMSESLLAARLETFRNAWPHDGKRGWKCTSKKLASAGWTYNPVPEADDCVQCFYCNCSLDGWEPKDDPWEEHHRRNPDCAFFSLVEASTVAKPTHSKRADKSRSSKVSRSSTRSNLPAVSDDESNDLENVSVAEEGDTILSTVSKTTGGRKKAVAKKTKAHQKSTRAMSVVVSHDPEMPDNASSQQLEVGSTDGGLPQSKAPAKRVTRGKKQDYILDSSVMEIEAPEAAEAVSKPARKGRGKQASTAPADAGLSDEVHKGAAQTKPRTQRGRKRGTDATEMADTSVVSAAGVSVAPKPKASRGKKRSSDGTVKADSSNFGDVEPKLPEIPAKSHNRAAKAARTTSNQMTQEANERISSNEDGGCNQPAANRAERFTKSSAVGLSSDTQHASPELQNEKQEQVPARSESFRIPEAGVLSTQRSPSPQSSDAENQAPSARVSLQAQRLPLAANTPARQSPSKRNIVGGLLSSSTWQAVDVESIFSHSPALHAIGQENVKLEDVLKSLSSPEKKMTVEEWMLHNAHLSEDKLRAECERMINLFEGEGNKALQSLKGITVA